MVEPTDDAMDAATETPTDNAMDPNTEMDLAPDAQPNAQPQGATLDAASVLDTLAERPLTEHAEVYEELHAELQRTLAEIDGG